MECLLHFYRLSGFHFVRLLALQHLVIVLVHGGTMKKFNQCMTQVIFIGLLVPVISGCSWGPFDSSENTAAAEQEQSPGAGTGSGSEGLEVPESGAATSRDGVSAGDTAAFLSWDSIDGATSYIVYYSTNPTFDRNTATKLNDTVGTISGTSAAVEGLTNDTAYYFWIEPVDGAGVGTEVELGSSTPSATIFSVVVSSMSPQINAIEVNPSVQLVIPFNAAIDPSSISPSPIAVTVDGQDVPVSLALVNSGQSIEVTPANGSWALGSEHVINLSTGIESLAGSALAESFDFRFTTLDTASLVAWWNFDNSLLDASGNGNVLDTNSGVTFNNQAGLFKAGTHSAYFNGSSHLKLTNASFDLGEQFSVATWINIPTIGYSINTVLSNASAGESTSGFKIGVNNWNTTDKRVIMEAGNGSAGGKVYTQPDFVQNGQWYHFAYNVDTNNLLPNGKHVQIFFNGEEADVSFNTTSIENMDWTAMKTTGPIYIGAFSPGSSYRLNGGYLDDLRVYNRTLTAAEVLNISR